MGRNIFSWFLTLVVLVVSSSCYANTCIASSGDWSATSTWTNCGGGIPQNGDVVLIPDNVVVDVSASNQYSANSSAPLLSIFVGDDDGDSDGGLLDISGKLNLKEGSSIAFYGGAKSSASGPGNSERIRWIDNGGAVISTLNGSSVEFCGPIEVTDGVSGPLPIELESFETSVIDGIITLDWVTSSELNNDFFEIQRSIDLKTWVVIDTIIGAGTSYKTSHYTAYDKPKMEDTYYYRLKQTDYDGQYSLSYLSVVNFGALKPNTLEIFPNPAHEMLYVTGNYNISTEGWIISDHMGNAVLSSSELRTNSVTEVDLKSLDSGIYYFITSRSLNKFQINK